ncbi:hypothetical protein ABFX02_14G074000 [Erythranthe guttata]
MGEEVIFYLLQFPYFTIQYVVPCFHIILKLQKTSQSLCCKWQPIALMAISLSMFWNFSCSFSFFPESAIRFNNNQHSSWDRCPKWWMSFLTLPIITTTLSFLVATKILLPKPPPLRQILRGSHLVLSSVQTLSRTRRNIFPEIFSFRHFSTLSN